MNKTELIAAVAEKTGLTKKDTERVLNAMIDTVTGAMAAKEKVQLSGFGTFSAKYRAERMGRNPRTKEPTKIAAAWVPAFSPSKALKDSMDK